MDCFEIENKIHEIRSIIASNWPNIQERKKLYEELEKLEQELKEKKENQSHLLQ